MSIRADLSLKVQVQFGLGYGRSKGLDWAVALVSTKNWAQKWRNRLGEFTFGNCFWLSLWTNQIVNPVDKFQTESSLQFNIWFNSWSQGLGYSYDCWSCFGSARLKHQGLRYVLHVILNELSSEIWHPRLSSFLGSSNCSANSLVLMWARQRRKTTLLFWLILEHIY